MTRIISTVHLSDIQKELMCKVQASPNPQVAWETISKAESEIDDNFVAAKDVLGNLGLLTVGDGILEITDQGLSVMQDENLVDEMGELTEEGEKLAGIDRAEVQEPNEPENPEGTDQLGGLDALGPEESGQEGIPMESLSLVKFLHEQSEIIKELKDLSSKSRC